MPSDEEIDAVSAEKDNTKKLALPFIKIANAYAVFAGQTNDKSMVLSLYEKAAHYLYLAGIVYQYDAHDNETACWYYLFATLAAEREDDSPYKAVYDSPVCDLYRP